MTHTSCRFVKNQSTLETDDFFSKTINCEKKWKEGSFKDSLTLFVEYPLNGGITSIPLKEMSLLFVRNNDSIIAITYRAPEIKVNTGDSVTVKMDTLMKKEDLRYYATPGYCCSKRVANYYCETRVVYRVQPPRVIKQD